MDTNAHPDAPASGTNVIEIRPRTDAAVNAPSSDPGTVAAMDIATTTPDPRDEDASGSTLPSFRVAHTSDWHLGYEAYQARNPSGHNQRGADLVKAAKQVVSDLIAWDPELVIIAGDSADKPNGVAFKYLVIIRDELARAASLRPDGSRRQVVLLSGNHDQPRNRREICFLELFANTPGVHVVTTSYERVNFPDAGQPGGAPAALTDVVVHALPHDELKTVEWEAVRPVEGKVNILSAHGVAGGSELYVRALGREFAIPTEVLNRGWEYGALGHWHKRTPVNPRVWYSGSPENVSFRDLKDNGTKRGYLRVTIHPGDAPEVTTVDLPIRPMFRLPVLDAAGMEPEAIEAALLERIRDADLYGAVVGQIVEGVSRDRWALVDSNRVRKAAGAALAYEVTCRFDRAADRREGRATVQGADVGSVGELMASRAPELFQQYVEDTVELATTLVDAELSARGSVDQVAGASEEGAA